MNVPLGQVGSVSSVVEYSNFCGADIYLPFSAQRGMGLGHVSPQNNPRSLLPTQCVEVVGTAICPQDVEPEGLV